MKEQITERLSKIIESTRILSPNQFSFDGKTFTNPVAAPVNQPIPATGSQPNAGAAQSALISLLQSCFYQYCYVQPFAGDNSSLETGQVTPNPQLVQQLSAANETREHWEAGWQIKETLPTGQIRAEKAGRTRLLWAGEFISHHGFGMPPQPDAYISVFFPKESTTIQPGFYFAFSETYLDQLDDYNIVRFYWNVEEKGAPDLMRGISRGLNRFQVPYRFKCLNNQLPFNRTDSAVLFLNKRFYRIAVELLVDIYEEMRGALGAETPLFSKPLAPGLGLAEDPGSGDSFGMNRCRILAEGVWNGYTKGLQTIETRLEEVVRQFEINGIALERPFLNAGSVDQYIVPKFKI
jgi:hypothetical protein